jgi:hypothetical protein
LNYIFFWNIILNNLKFFLRKSKIVIFFYIIKKNNEYFISLNLLINNLFISVKKNSHFTKNKNKFIIKILFLEKKLINNHIINNLNFLTKYIKINQI